VAVGNIMVKQLSYISAKCASINLTVNKMSFISRDEIKKRFKGSFDQGIFEDRCFSQSGASYDLRLGEEVFVTPEKQPKQLQKGQILNINPGQFAVLTTQEYLEIPEDLLGFITVRFRYKSKGLVNISGFHVDPGFKGHLVFSVYNSGPATVTLRQGDPVFSIFFAEISPKTVYKGDYRNQKNIPLDIIETLAGARIPSIRVLEDKVNRNSTILRLYGTILTGLVVALVSIVIGIIQGLIG